MPPRKPPVLPIVTWSITNQSSLIDHSNVMIIHCRYKFLSNHCLPLNAFSSCTHTQTHWTRYIIIHDNHNTKYIYFIFKPEESYTQPIRIYILLILFTKEHFLLFVYVYSWNTYFLILFCQLSNKKIERGREQIMCVWCYRKMLI